MEEVWRGEWSSAQHGELGCREQEWGPGQGGGGPRYSWGMCQARGRLQRGEDSCQAWGTPQALRVRRGGSASCGCDSGFAEVEGSLPGTGCAFNLPRLRAHCQGAAATQATPRLRAHCSVVRDRAQHRSLGCSVDRDCARLRQLQLTGTGSVDRVWAMVPFAVDSTDERPTTRGIRYKAWSVCRKLAATQALPRLRVHCRGPAAL